MIEPALRAIGVDLALFSQIWGQDSEALVAVDYNKGVLIGNVMAERGEHSAHNNTSVDVARAIILQAAA